MSPVRPASPMRQVWRVVGRLAGFDLRRYVTGALLWLPVSVLPIAGGLVLQAFFDHVSDGRAANLEAALWLCAAFVAVEVVRGVVLATAWTYGVYWWDAAATLLRAGVLRSLLTSPGPAASRLPGSSGESVSRLRDDVDDTVDLADESVGLAGALLFTTGALAIMLTIDPVVTLVLVVPMLAVGVLSWLMRNVIRRLHRRARTLGAAVTACVGDLFTGVLAIKSAGAEAAALERLREHNRRRRDAAVKDRLATDLLDTATGATVDVSVGLVLLLGVSAMRRGDFTVGDLALFTSYLSMLTQLPRTIGVILSRLPQVQVATERLGRLMGPDEGVAALAARDDAVWFHRPPPPAPAPPARDEPLRALEARGLSVRFGDGGRGRGRGALSGVDLRLARGSFTVVTGAVGAGKTTLLRALLGLLPLSEGTVLWNGRPVEDPGTFLVPGRAAYVGQVPRLFSASLRENLLLGWPATEAQLTDALGRAVLDKDVAGMADGLDTVVGPRGVRLSGGQVQRVTAARALVRTPELLVVDDLSSAVDVETEEALWDRLAAGSGGPTTLLVVSHRRTALSRADQVVVLDRGTVAGQGTLAELLRDCEEMRRLWSQELIAEAEELTAEDEGRRP